MRQTGPAEFASNLSIAPPPFEFPRRRKHGYNCVYSSQPGFRGGDLISTEVTQMDQVFEGTPKAEISLDDRKVTRGDVTNDWGSKIQWVVKKNGKVVATVAARAEASYEHPDSTPGKYEIVLQQFKYVNFKKTGKGPDANYTESKFIDISKPVSYSI